MEIDNDRLWMLQRDLEAAEKTLEVIREDYTNQLLAWLRLGKNITNGNYKKVSESYGYQTPDAKTKTTWFEQMTVLQLRALLRQINNFPDADILLHGFGIGFDMYFGIERHGMYLGIEKDGYIHS